MRLKSIFFLLSCVLFSVLSLLVYLTLRNATTIFYLLEAVIIITFIFLFYFYRKVVKPLHTIGNGMELLREQDFSSRLSPVGQYEADCIVDIFNRMIDQLKEERLRQLEQNHLLNLLIDASPMGVVMLDLDEKVASLNPAAVRFLNIPSSFRAEGKKLAEIDTSLTGELSQMKPQEVKTIRLSDANVYRCSRLSFIDRGFPHPFFLIEMLTAEVMKAEKKAYEKVIRMISHEVNNTTAGIISTLDTIDQTLAETRDAEDLQEVIRICMERCYGMNRFITNFADVVKIPEPQFRLCNLTELVFSCKRFMENICNERHIGIRLSLPGEPVECKLDALLFEQVLVNIIKNAAESIGENGTIYIQVTDSPFCLEIADTGKGIDKETEKKLFSPFFSTKPNGQGIGLIFIREVLLCHDCTFSLKTYPDGLTRFKIFFP